MPEHIIFHSRGRQLAILSNFAPHSFALDGKRFSCGESFFHFAKFGAAAKVYAAASKPDELARRERLTAHASKFADSELSGLAAKRMGGKGPQGLRLEGAELQAWDAQRDEVQRLICTARLSQGDAAAEVARALIGSGDAVLVHFERGARPDTYWGGKVVQAESGESRIVGQNVLGNMWMEQRALLLKRQAPNPAA
jgi:predicted NAD-dependent protein-ADP-ribosyltransferase YbiA (DUF1768 family)